MHLVKGTVLYSLLLVVVQLLSHVQLFATPWTTACQASLSFTISWSLLKLMSIESVMSSNHLILCCPLSYCLQSFPALGSFQMSQLFASGGQSIGASASASVFPIIIQCCPRDSQESSPPPRFESINSLVLSSVQLSH